ncbi:MAG: MG2 domain-containing protein, partial [Chitinophagales bacterium]
MTRIAAVFLPILFLSYPFCSAQTGRANYDAKWKEIDSLYSKKGLTESALKKVNQVYALAKKEHNEPQAIKALIYRMSLTEKKEEGAIQKNIAGLNEEIGLSSGPPRSILYSLLATTYWNYFQNHRWNLYNRTATVQFKKEDITSWDIEDFHEHISSAFLASISEEKLFQQTSLSSYDPLIVKGNVRNLRPTLFDLLAHEALEYFEDNESDLSRASYTFEIDQEAAFAKAREFANFHINSQDSTSLQLQAIRLFQRLIKFHLNDANPDALIDLDIERIQFANMYGVMESKDSLYLTALKKITDQFGSNPIAAEAWYLQAKYYAEQAGRYDPIKDTLNQFGYVRALKICEQVINEPDSSEGKSGCQSLAHSIERTELSLQAEKVNSLNKPFRILVSNRNLDKAYFRLIKLNKTLRERLNEDREDEKYWNKLIGTKPLREFEQSMPNPGDHQMHRVEMRIDSLASGEYLLLTSTKPDFPLKENILSAQSILVSNISYIHFGRDYFVLDRESGQPLAGTDVQAWYTYYAGSQDKWVERMGEHFITDKNGYFQLFPPKVNNNNQVYLEVAKSGDHLFMNNANNTVYDPENDNSMYGGQPKSGQIKNRNRTFLFTDRSIYRPGQVVYFKGIVITKENSSRESKILSNFKTRLTLFEVNSQKIDSLELTSNEFGTYHGQFILPEGLLTGMFRIEDMGTESQQYISVEEYKRPKFYVEFEKFKGIHRLNDRILLKGFAKAFAGNTIDGAKVKYRVTRQAIFPYLWIRGISGINRTGSQEISHGETKSFTDGSFEIPFKAMADLSIDKRSHAYFEFKIEADITDINEETRSGNTVVRIGYDDIRISIALFDNAEIGVDSLKNLSVRTESLSGEFQSSLVHLDIYALQSPDRLIRQRYWEEPDQHIMN